MDLGRLRAAAALLYRGQLQLVHLADDEATDVTKDEIADFVQWFDLLQLKLLRKIAENLGPFFLASGIDRMAQPAWHDLVGSRPR